MAEIKIIIVEIKIENIFHSKIQIQDKSETIKLIL
jgi:hypothetical protein